MITSRREFIKRISLLIAAAYVSPRLIVPDSIAGLKEQYPWFDPWSQFGDCVAYGNEDLSDKCYEYVYGILKEQIEWTLPDPFRSCVKIINIPPTPVEMYLRGVSTDYDLHGFLAWKTIPEQTIKVAKEIGWTWGDVPHTWVRKRDEGPYPGSGILKFMKG